MPAGVGSIAEIASQFALLSGGTADATSAHERLRARMVEDTQPVKGGHEMSLGRILLAVAVAACLLGVGVLEVLSERAPRERLLPTFPKVGDLRSGDTEPWWESGEAVSGQALEAALAAPEGALTGDAEQRRLTVIEVDENARRLVSVSGAGQVLITNLGRNPSVVSDERAAALLATLKPGDVVRIEPAGGHAQRVIVLRHAGSAEGEIER